MGLKLKHAWVLAVLAAGCGQTAGPSHVIAAASSGGAGSTGAQTLTTGTSGSGSSGVHVSSTTGTSGIHISTSTSGTTGIHVSTSTATSTSTSTSTSTTSVASSASTATGTSTGTHSTSTSTTTGSHSSSSATSTTGTTGACDCTALGCANLGWTCDLAACQCVPPAATTGHANNGTTSAGTAGTTGTTGSGSVAICQPCSRDGDCSSGFCNTLSGPTPFCDSTFDCGSSADCEGFACDTRSGACNCASQGTTGTSGSTGTTGTAPGGACSTCSRNSDCNSGYCNTFSGPSGFCDASGYCDTSADCDGQFNCLDIYTCDCSSHTSGGTTGSSGTTGTTGALPGEVCSTCSRNSECNSGFCNRLAGTPGHCDSASICSASSCGAFACGSDSYCDCSQSGTGTTGSTGSTGGSLECHTCTSSSDCGATGGCYDETGSGVSGYCAVACDANGNCADPGSTCFNFGTNRHPQLYCYPSSQTCH